VAFYQQIIMLQSEPYDLGVDERNRSKWQFNVMATKTASQTFVEELAKVLATAGVGTYNVNIFGTSKAAIPTGDGPYLSIIPTGGPGPVRIHNQPAPAYPRPTAMIVVRGTVNSQARAMAFAAYDAIAKVVNQTVTP
jgi:hypothetical protein